MVDYKKIGMIFLSLFASLQADFMLFDQGHTVVSGPIADVIITHCDVYEKRSLDGRLVPVDDQINMIIIEQEIKESKMPIDETAPDKYIANIKKDHNLSDEDLEDLAAQCGRTLPEVKQLLSSQYMRDFLLWHKFRAHLVPTDQAIEEYCKEHPEIESGFCTILVAFVDYTQANKKEVRQIIDDIVNGTVQDAAIVSWSDPIKVDTDNIADDKIFIKDLAPGEISVIDDKSVFEMYKLVEKREERFVPVEDRKALVIDQLNREMYEDLLTNYEQHMRDNVAIIHLVPIASV